TKPASNAATENTGSSTEVTVEAPTGEAFASLPDKLSDGVVAATPEMYSNIDLSSPYTVHMYLVGDTPNDWKDVLGEINAYLEPFNTTLDVTFMSWADYNTMYSLVLAGGEEIDCIYTAPWCYMFTEAAKGSFKVLSDDFVNKYMPLTAKYQDPKSFKESTVNGQLVAIPANNETAQNKIVAIRQDIAEKYGITELKNWDDYMNYMLTVAEKETPVSGIYAQASSADNVEVWHVYRQQYDTFYLLDDNYLTYMFQYDGQVPEAEDIKFAWDTDIFRGFAKDMKKLADAGCWSRSALSATTTDDEAFGALQGASIAWNGTVFTYMKQAENTEGVKCAAYDLTTDHLVACEEFNNSDFGITASSKNPERTAMVLDILKMDTKANRLATLGIEGVHYTINDDNTYNKLDKAGDYPADGIALSWAIRNSDRRYTEAGRPEREEKMYSSWDERIVGNPAVTFVFDDAKVADEAAAVKSIIAEYIYMLQLGLVDDPDASIDEMLERCNKAGLEKVTTELIEQYKEWLKTQ
ncbi:MAG: ABC transporter substrate-binding protein, partial [Lachnospiraceae bacterium]|nr:ABC transporter substrate-binding protein [Lachnospiraceae bacterium]